MSCAKQRSARCSTRQRPTRTRPAGTSCSAKSRTCCTPAGGSYCWSRGWKKREDTPPKRGKRTNRRRQTSGGSCASRPSGRKRQRWTVTTRTSRGCSRSTDSRQPDQPNSVRGCTSRNTAGWPKRWRRCATTIEPKRRCRRGRHDMRSSATASTGPATPAGRRPVGSGMSDGQDRAPDGGGISQARGGREAQVSRQYIRDGSNDGLGLPDGVPDRRQQPGAMLSCRPGREPTPPVAAQRPARCALPRPSLGVPGPARQDAGVTPRPHSLEIAVRSRGSLRLRGSLPRVSPNWGHRTA